MAYSENIRVEKVILEEVKDWVKTTISSPPCSTPKPILKPDWQTSTDSDGKRKSISTILGNFQERLYPLASVKSAYRCFVVGIMIAGNHLKTTLGMEMLQAQSPEMVRKEIYVHLMAYNLLRSLMWQAASQTGQVALRFSVQGSRQSFNQFRSLLAEAGRVRLSRYSQKLLDLIAQTTVPLRPNRYEPRKRKRRPKAFPLMNEPRATLQQKLLAA